MKLCKLTTYFKTSLTIVYGDSGIYIFIVISGNCVQVSLDETPLLGDYRWSFTVCQALRPFICETESCSDGQYQCSNRHTCINENWLCDGFKDCPDGSDEGFICKGSYELLIIYYNIQIYVSASDLHAFYYFRGDSAELPIS